MTSRHWNFPVHLSYLATWVLLGNSLAKKPGDILEARLEDGRIVLVPTVAVPKDQTWYWARERQAEEQEVNEQQERGEIKGPMERDEALSVLDGLMRRDGH